MSKRIITLGTWDGKPIEWIVLKEESFGTLVLCMDAICYMSLSWNGTWASCNFRTEPRASGQSVMLYAKTFENDYWITK